jgi:hypothetical protein
MLKNTTNFIRNAGFVYRGQMAGHHQLKETALQRKIYNTKDEPQLNSVSFLRASTHNSYLQN